MHFTIPISWLCKADIFRRQNDTSRDISIFHDAVDDLGLFLIGRRMVEMRLSLYWFSGKWNFAMQEALNTLKAEQPIIGEVKCTPYSLFLEDELL